MLALNGAWEGLSGVVDIFHDVKHLLYHEKEDSECIMPKSFGFHKGSRLENECDMRE